MANTEGAVGVVTDTARSGVIVGAAIAVLFLQQSLVEFRPTHAGGAGE
ncbi:hypothetical protein [Salinisphaera sp. LB1]|nr:hypothetical protein [Salinisphaera sp. LB1]